MLPPPCASRLTALREWGVEAEALLSFMFGVTPATAAATAADAAADDDESGGDGGDDGDGDGGDCEGAGASTREGGGGGGDGAGWDNPARSWQVQRSQPVLWELHFWAQVRGCGMCMARGGDIIRGVA